MKDILFKIIDKFTKGVETYHNHGSMWLIFTDEKKWVIELTKEGTLWYNFYFFQDCFKYVSLDVVENEHYITEWVESIIQNGVRSTPPGGIMSSVHVEDIIQNGVKETIYDLFAINNGVEDIIQNGVKDAQSKALVFPSLVEDAIQNGVKETKHDLWDGGLAMEDAIQNGVKRTELGGKDRKIDEIKDIVENGIKETHEDVYHHNGRVEGVIKNGIKETNPHLLEIYNPMNFEPEIKEMKRMNEVNIVLEKGIKETKYCELHSLMRADHIIRDGDKIDV